MRHTIHDVEAWIGQDLVGVDSQPVGKIKDVYLDAATEQPEWLAVKTGGFGGGVSFVPLAEAQRHGDGVRVPYAAATIESAPSAKPDGELTQDEEARLYDHYGLVYGESRSGSGLPEYEDDPVEVPVEWVVPVDEAPPPPAQQAPPPPPAPEPEPVGHAVSGPATDNAFEEEHEVVLHEEEVVVEKRVVPKERVRMDKQLVTDEQTVTDEIRKEQIEVEGADQARVS